MDLKAFKIKWRRFDNQDPKKKKIISTSRKTYTRKEAKRVVKFANKHFTEADHWLEEYTMEG